MKGDMKLLDYQISAIHAVREYAKEKHASSHAFVESICKPFNVDVNILVHRVLSNSITINFHPDRLSNNGKTIIESLTTQGLYHGQFRTGTTNGGASAYIGGDRFLWEQRLFFDAYPQSSLDRPKYGALNLFRYIDGASSRFGSCFFSLKNEVRERCTFSYGDSSTNPDILCTHDTFVNILAGIINDVQQKHRLLNQVIATEQEALAILSNPCSEVRHLGRNLDYCIETHVHGDISLAEDVESFYVDESFFGTSIETMAKELCHKYDIRLEWTPKRQVNVANIEGLFRGPKIPLLARRIDALFGRHEGIINAALIGEASCNSLLNPEAWHDIGSEQEAFQYFKQLWHTVAFMG